MRQIYVVPNIKTMIIKKVKVGSSHRPRCTLGDSLKDFKEITATIIKMRLFHAVGAAKQNTSFLPSDHLNVYFMS